MPILYPRKDPQTPSEIAADEEIVRRFEAGEILQVDPEVESKALEALAAATRDEKGRRVNITNPHFRRLLAKVAEGIQQCSKARTDEKQAVEHEILRMHAMGTTRHTKIGRKAIRYVQRCGGLDDDLASRRKKKRRLNKARCRKRRRPERRVVSDTEFLRIKAEILRQYGRSFMLLAAYDCGEYKVDPLSPSEERRFRAWAVRNLDHPVDCAIEEARRDYARGDYLGPFQMAAEMREALDRRGGKKRRRRKRSS